MVKIGQKSIFLSQPHGNPQNEKKIIKYMAQVVDLDLSNTASLLHGHIWFSGTLG